MKKIFTICLLLIVLSSVFAEDEKKTTITGTFGFGFTSNTDQYPTREMGEDGYNYKYEKVNIF
ncbi:MAG: hypothetical protein LBM77_07665 [Spirochaetaceae bacterium]|jgi:hypothetical protein|nr:hypothetical protein [Spirochaetaceae bacterium]